MIYDDVFHSNDDDDAFHSNDDDNAFHSDDVAFHSDDDDDINDFKKESWCSLAAC